MFRCDEVANSLLAIMKGICGIGGAICVEKRQIGVSWVGKVGITHDYANGKICRK